MEPLTIDSSAGWGKSLDTDDLTMILEHTLSHPPTEPGKRLRPDRELARLFQTGLSRVQTSLGRLEKKGLLERRRGSGTFVRRVGQGLSSSRIGTLPESFSLPSIFVEKVEPKSAASRFQASYHLALWGDLKYTNAVNQNVYAAIVAEVGRLGHSLTIHSCDKKVGEPFPVERMHEQLENLRCDGLIVLEGWGKAFEQLPESANCPIVYFSCGMARFVYEPIVYFDTHHASMRALRQLHEQGYERIGLLALVNNFLGHLRSEVEAYRHWQSKHQSGYSRIVQANELQLKEVREQIRVMLADPDRPDALYVADDTLLGVLAEEMEELGVTPGSDLGVVTLSNQGMALPSGLAWSRMEFRSEDMAHLLADQLVSLIENNQPVLSSVGINAVWTPGDTHTTGGAV